MAHDDLGVTVVRAHAILHDDNRVVHRARRRLAGLRLHAWSTRSTTSCSAIGIRPVVELSFMPAAMAARPDQTVFAYRGIISPPA